MRRFVQTILFVLISIILSSIIYLSVFDHYAFNSNFYIKHFLALKVHESIGISQADLENVVDNLITYIDNGSGDLHVHATLDQNRVEFFNPKEQAHLNDIKILVRSARKVRLKLLYSLLGLMMLGFAFSLKSLRDMLKILPLTALASLVTLLLLVALYLIDFDWAFRRFHEILFYNDLWLLNPAKDRLLQMMPLEFFMIFTRYFLGTVFGINALLLAVYYLLRPRERHMFIK